MTGRGFNPPAPELTGTVAEVGARVLEKAKNHWLSRPKYLRVEIMAAVDCLAIQSLAGKECKPMPPEVGKDFAFLASVAIVMLGACDPDMAGKRLEDIRDELNDGSPDA